MARAGDGKVQAACVLSKGSGSHFPSTPPLSSLLHNTVWAASVFLQPVGACLFLVNCC